MQENPHGREIAEAIAEIAGVTFGEVVGAYRRSLEVDEQGNVSILIESVERELNLPSGLFKTCLHASPEAAVELLISKKKSHCCWNNSGGHYVGSNGNHVQLIIAEKGDFEKMEIQKKAEEVRAQMGGTIFAFPVNESDPFSKYAVVVYAGGVYHTYPEVADLSEAAAGVQTILEELKKDGQDVNYQKDVRFFSYDAQVNAPDVTMCGD